MAAALTEAKLQKLKYTGKPRYVPDGGVSGLYVRVRARKKIFYVQARDAAGRQQWQPIGNVGEMSLKAARERALALRAAISETEAGGLNSWFDVSRMWFRRYVQKKALRTAPEIERTLKKHCSAWDAKAFESINRRDVAELMDRIEDRSGPAAADKTLATISRVCTWYESRHAHYRSPVVRGMKRHDKAPRDRILNDDELRTLWAETDDGQTYSSMIRLLLLTAQRREKVQQMRWSDIGDGVWTVPHEERQKGVGGSLKLSELALAELNRRPRFVDNDHVLPGRSPSRYLNGLSRPHVDLVKRCEFHFTRHDLRRTARSLMARARVPEHIAERVLGHAQEGIKKVYDHYDYAAEKAEALAALDRLLQGIIEGVERKILVLEPARKRA